MFFFHSSKLQFLNKKLFGPTVVFFFQPNKINLTRQTSTLFCRHAACVVAVFTFLPPRRCHSDWKTKNSFKDSCLQHIFSGKHSQRHLWFYWILANSDHIELGLPQATHLSIFYGKISIVALHWLTCSRRSGDREREKRVKKPSTRQDLNPQPLDHEALSLLLSLCNAEI